MFRSSKYTEIWIQINLYWIWNISPLIIIIILITSHLFEVCHFNLLEYFLKQQWNKSQSCETGYYLFFLLNYLFRTKQYRRLGTMASRFVKDQHFRRLRTILLFLLLNRPDKKLSNQNEGGFGLIRPIAHFYLMIVYCIFSFFFLYNHTMDNNNTTVPGLVNLLIWLTTI